MKSLLLIFLLLFVEFMPGSVFSEKDLKITSYNKKKQGSKAPKKVFIRSFNAYFEVFEEASAKTSGSKKERANRTTFTSGTSTRMGVQIQGVDVPDFQQMIDEAYESFVNQLKSQGFEIMTADEASQFEYYQGWTKMRGGASSDSQVEGYIMVTPTGYEYLVKSVTKEGKEKKGGGLVDPTPKISKELENAFIADVTFAFPFVNLDADASVWTNSSSVKATIGYRIDPFLDPSENNRSISNFGSSVIPTQVRFVSGLDIGSSPLFNAKVEPKKAVFAEGVFKDKKIKEVTQAQTDMFSKTSYTQLVMTSGDQATVASHFADCDRDAYVQFASGAMKDMIDTGISNFFELTQE
ncbi:hypothetical protein E4S40_07200 [Algoriphagus kandeliae]|uniref:Uncharacterized protein n=1 Tax=Algoriphagus kandeliae TaxID=2562278 RepID=A0A4Y9QY93_9BACT|nr:hypothetical protein [Algoriphagus kandeliae]TFV96005.1 hypothetical protein E4S40_07200 [Algoriphagus kandeliae]